MGRAARLAPSPLPPVCPFSLGRAAAPRAMLVALAVAGSAHAADADPAAPRGAAFLDQLAGSWSGAGVAGPSPGAVEAVRCRVDAVEVEPGGTGTLHLALRCAARSAAIEIEADLRQHGRQIEGTLAERRTGITGTLSGEAGSGRMDATVAGVGLSGLMAVELRRRAGTVTLKGLGPIAAATATVALQRMR